MFRFYSKIDIDANGFQTLVYSKTQTCLDLSESATKLALDRLAIYGLAFHIPKPHVYQEAGMILMSLAIKGQ